MNEILSQAELEHDLAVMIGEHLSSRDAFGQMPATSYSNGLAGYTNLRNILKLAISKIVGNQQEFPTIYFSVEKLWHFNCSRCKEWWTIGDWKTASGPTAICPHCGHMGLMKSQE